jgi:hypothetical protein
VLPFLISCVDSFRDAYERTGMNLAQSVIVFAAGMAQKGWAVISHRSSVVSHRTDD